jgi:hypothetical protein
MVFNQLDTDGRLAGIAYLEQQQRRPDPDPGANGSGERDPSEAGQVSV